MDFDFRYFYSKICLQFGFNEKLLDSQRSSDFCIMYFEASFLF